MRLHVSAGCLPPQAHVRGMLDARHVAVYTSTKQEVEQVPRATKVQYDKRIREVEHALLTYPWTLDTQRQLAQRHGVTDRQIREDAAKVRKQWAADAVTVDRDESKADWLQRLRMAQHQARTNKQTIALGRLLALEARAMGFEAPVQVQVEHTVEELDPVSQAKAIVQHYAEARRLLLASGERVPDAPAVIDAAFEETK